MTERAWPALLLLGWAFLPAAALGAEPRCAHHDPLRRPFFGDLHVHTLYSLDASTQGTRTTPAQAYDFARGEALGLHPFAEDGTALRTVRLPRPLDFAAVTDHAELFGETATCNTPGLPGYEAFVCSVYRGWPRLAFFLMNARGSPRFRFCGEDGEHCAAAARDPWADIRESAAAANDTSPACAFTTFVGLEWTAQASGARNLHRNIVFRGDVVPDPPPNSIDQATPEELWSHLDAHCRPDEGCEAIVIPHNSNLSGGTMFEPSTLTPASAARRAERERLVEIMQHKGSSECARSTAPADELCGFEELPYDRFMGRFLPLARQPGAPLNFTRHALAAGLAEARRLGVNPFQFGVIASTDTHLGTPGLVAEAADYPGHGGAGAPIGASLPDRLLDEVEFNPGGLAVLWAEENSREALFEAMQRRETYGTSGPRIVLRFFAGFDLPANLCERSDFAAQGYAGGVSMGAELGPVEGDRPLRLAVSALRDPGTAQQPGVPLQRLQIVKAWVADGATHERVVDVGGNAANGASVDPATCAPTGPGSDALCSVWEDPDFDPDAPALYYARVVENPSCRWHTRACLARGVRCEDGPPRGYEACCDAAWPRTVQERAWSSPIWWAGAR